MRETVIKVFTFGFFILCCFVIMILLLGCTTSPDKKNYADRPASCFDKAYCDYLASLSKVEIDCSDTGKECRALERYIKCKDEKFRDKDQKFQECWDKLNSK